MYFSRLILCYAVFYAELGGSTLDSHHGFIVEFGMHRDVEMGKSYALLEFLYP
jgi:hypothetical protein